MWGDIQYNAVEFEAVEKQLRSLWIEAFGDSEKYVDRFFSLMDVGKCLHTLSNEGRVLSALYAIPYMLLHDGKEFPVVYIYAVATLKEFQGCGYMSILMQRVHDELRRNGVAAALLIPAETWLWGYYERLGYELSSWRHKVKITALHSEVCSGRLYEVDSLTEEIYRFVTAKMRERNCSILHSRESIEMNICNCCMSGGGFFIMRDDVNIEAAAFAILQDGVPYLLEIYANRAMKQKMVNLLCAYYCVDAIEICEADLSATVPVAMMLRFSRDIPHRISLSLMLDE